MTRGVGLPVVRRNGHRPEDAGTASQSFFLVGVKSCQDGALVVGWSHEVLASGHYPDPAESAQCGALTGLADGQVSIRIGGFDSLA